jgi:hypothetical protein
LRQIDLVTRRVTTIKDTRISTGIIKPKRLSYDINKFDILLSSEHSLAKYNEQLKSLTLIAGNTSIGSSDGALSTAMFKFPSEILSLTEKITLVAGNDHNRLHIRNTSSETVTYICTGYAGTVDGEVESCRLRFPRSLLLLNNTLFIGQKRSIRSIAGQRTT